MKGRYNRLHVPGPHSQSQIHLNARRLCRCHHASLLFTVHRSSLAHLSLTL